MLASAGVAGVAIGFGAQSVVLDIRLAPDEDVSRVRDVLDDLFEDLRADPQLNDWIREWPTVLGVETVSEFAKVLRVTAATQADAACGPLMVAAACGGGGGEDTGSVNVLNAMEPAEAEVVQGIVDEMIAADADYDVEIEASTDFETQFQIRAEGGTLDIALLP